MQISSKIFSLFVLLCVALGLTTLTGCGNGDPMKPTTPAYRDAVSAFYTGTIALQSGDKSGHAESELRKLTQQVPQEPAGWANLALLQIRANDLKSAAESLQKATSQDPGKDKIATSQIAALRGLLAQQQGDFPEAVARYREASTLDPANLRALYRIKSVVEQQRDPQADSTILEITRRILQSLPTNLEALLEQARVAARKGDTAITKDALQKSRSNPAPGRRPRRSSSLSSRKPHRAATCAMSRCRLSGCETRSKRCPRTALPWTPSLNRKASPEPHWSAC